MQGMEVGVHVRGIEVESRPDLVVQEGQIELEASPEENSVELLRRAVGESHRRALDLGQPRPDGDTPLADEGQVVLVERDAGDRQRLCGSGRSVLLGAAAGLDDDLLELTVDLLSGECLLGEASIAREDAVIRRHACGELRQHVALSPLGHDHARGIVVHELRRDLESADRATRHEHPLPPVPVGLPVGVRRGGSKGAR